MSLSRRHALLGTGITLAASAVAGCATYGRSVTPAPAAPESPGPEETTETTAALAATADVPVGSGIVVGDVVLTQPNTGEFKAFSAVCTHAGCTVSEVIGASITCPCHGSSFHLDGTVATGPAKRALDTTPITVQGNSITRA
ncbi:Rieske (2Fe-2S) protein [Mycolicibacterium sp. jd]|jgi:Rieske Fe-S protein|uniref:Rieske (2Fe-2S) protein n=1 Tax=Mycolicibacterium TaxID=1866885 RepID=UPI001CA38450|nr:MULTISPECIES: Rieske (2Fe-2S) protein [Mycolicibacterium]MDW5614243.1 Rieske (2Fe-2S) protein [Mycolicibacterium sp. D5.8-2]QZT55107.1 Rieske (2Fe-2S) protein [Mycolicibacterium austroafricanum]